MADKTIGDLPIAQELYDDSLLVVEQQKEARSIKGELVRKFAREATADYAEQAKASAGAAAKSAGEAEAALGKLSDEVARATEQADNAAKSATQAKSYAVGDTGSREDEGTDNAKYYYDQAKRIAQGLEGGLLPMGTVTFAQLASQSKQAGYMYNISNGFTTDATFKEGPNHKYPAGTNVYYTADGYWDCLAGVQDILPVDRGGTGNNNNTVKGFQAYTASSSNKLMLRIESTNRDLGKWELSRRPDGVYEFDAGQGTMSQIYTTRNKPTANDVGALPTTGGKVTGPLNVGDKVQIRTDAEGGNIVIYPPDEYADTVSKWELDADNGNFRFGFYGPNGGYVRSNLVLNTDGTGNFSGNAATATKVGHALTFSGGETGSYNGSAAKTVKIPNTAADVNAVPTTRKVNNKPLSADVSLTADDVGAIGTCVSIPSNADLNEYKTEGIYGCTANSIASTIKNSPISISFALLVIPRGKGGSVVQIMVSGTGALYTRGSTSSSFGSWLKATTETVSSDPGAVEGPSAFDQLRADVDYIAAMQGVEL